jgi:hypothetical protein
MEPRSFKAISIDRDYTAKIRTGTDSPKENIPFVIEL